MIPCLGSLARVLPLHKMAEETKRLIAQLLAQYKKGAQMEPYRHCISEVRSSCPCTQAVQGLCQVLRASCGREALSSIVENYVEDVWVALFPQLCLDNDHLDVQAYAAQVKNRNEALRCFHVTGEFAIATVCQSYNVFQRASRRTVSSTTWCRRFKRARTNRSWAPSLFSVTWLVLLLGGDKVSFAWRSR